MKRIILIMVILTLATANASAWLSGYNYRTPIEINNTGDNLTYYQYNFTLDSAAEIAAGNMTYADGRDCRVTNATDVLQEFWNETAFNGSSTKIWVNASSLGNQTNTTHYCYYGRSGVSAYTNISKTMLFGDDFESGNLNQWDQSAGGTITSTAGEVYAGTYAVKTNQAINNFHENLSLGNILIIEADVKPIFSDSGWLGTIVGNTYDANSVLIGNFTPGNYWTYDGAFTDSGISWTGYKKLKFVINNTATMYYGDGNHLDTTLGAQNLAKFVLYSADADWIAMDNLFLREYAETEPISYIGAVESSSAGITYYVNNSWLGASDSNTGLSNTNTTAWKTVQKAANTMVAGDTCWVQSGTYNESVTISSSGTDGNLISFKGVGRPVINKTDGAAAAVISISGAWINFTGFNISAKDSSFEAGNVGIRLASGSNNSTVHDNIIITDSGTGVNFVTGGANHSTISDNVIYTGYRHGVRGAGGPWMHITIENNTIHADRYLQHKNNGNSCGINLYSSVGKSTDIDIISNDIYSCGYAAIKVGYGNKIGDLNISYNEMSGNAYSHNCLELTSNNATYIGNYIHDINTSWVHDLNAYYGASSEHDQNMTFEDNRLANSSSFGRGFTVGGHQSNILCKNLTITNFSENAVQNLGYNWGIIETSANITYVNTTIEMNSTTSYPIKIIQLGTNDSGWQHDDQTFIDLSVTGTYPSSTMWITDFAQFYGTVHFINSNKDDAYMSSASGNFNADAIFYYYADVLVVDTNGDPVSGANVAFTPNSTISAKNRDYTYVQYPGTTQNITDTTTGADGHTPKPYDDSSTVAIVDFKQDVSGKTYYNWTLNVSKSGYVTNDTIVIDPDNSWYRSVASSYQNTTTVVLTSTAQTDDFESYPIGSFNNTGQSNWTVEEGIWQIVSNGTQKLESSVSSRVRYLNYSQRNYNVSADVMFNSSASYVGMFTRWDGSKGTGYLVSCSVAFNTINLYVQKSSNTYAELELESFSFSPYQEYKLKVQMNDSVTTVYIDDVESLNYTDYYRVDTILSEGGYVGFSHVGGSAYFDNFSVITLTENSEYLSYFDYVSANASSVSLAWDLSGHTNATIHRGTNIDVITTEIYHGSATAHVDSGLASDTNYYYTITYDNSTEGHIIKAFTYDLPTTRKYVAIGDSISTDYGALQSNESFPYLLNETIVNNSDSNLTHHISATIGYTTNGIIFGELDDLLTEKPTFITLMAGWNDFYLDHNESDYRANFKYIINESNKHEIDVFVLKMINTSTAKVQSNIDDTNTWIDTLGERYVVDTYDAVDLTPFDGIHQGYNTSYYQDGVHPNLAGTTNLNKSIYGYMVGENYFSGTNIITLYADEYALINNWTADQTYQQIDNNITNAVCYSYYNSTSGLWEAYRAGYTYNHDATIPKNCSVVVFVDSDTTISATPNTGGITITQDEWFYGYLPGSTAKTLTEIETAMDADGLDVWNIYAFNNSSQTYTSTGSYSVAPNEGYAVYCNITGEYTP